MKRSSLLILLLIALFLPVCANAEIVYKVIDLGTLGGDSSWAYSINDSGQIVGQAINSSGWPHAALFDQNSNGNNIDLDPFGVNESWATSINNSGQIVGYVINRTNGLSIPQATLFDASGGGNNINLGCGRDSGAESINDKGQIVGYIDHATLFDSTGNCSNIDLGTIGDRSSSATSINNKGQIVGWVYASPAYLRATLFDASGSGNNIDLGTLGGYQSVPKSINESGQIVGWAENSSRHSRATLFDPTGRGNNIDLGTLGGDNSGAWSINNREQIVGYSKISPGDWHDHATLFDPLGNGNNTDLNTLIDPLSGWTLATATTINNLGWIVGHGFSPEGDTHAFLLIPELVTIVDLKISGPTEVVEGSSAQFRTTAYYEDRSVKDVTTLTIWSLEPPTIGKISENGLLTLEDVDTPIEILIKAQYNEGLITVESQKPVLCIPRTWPILIYVNQAVGNDTNNGLSPEAPFATIQKGVNTAQDGDTVLVYPGVYTEEIRFKGKAITVQSASDAAVLENPGDFAISFYYGEGPDSILKNFIIRNSLTGIFVVASSPTITNVTVVNNEYGIEAYVCAEPYVSNCIFWNNAEADVIGCQAQFSYIESEDPNEQPMFVNPCGGDFHLKSKRGRYWPMYDLWVLDKVTSPCIDAGDPNADYFTEPAPNGGRINIGAYGGTAYASMSEQPLEADVNQDGIVDLEDLIALIENWLQSAGWF